MHNSGNNFFVALQWPPLTIHGWLQLLFNSSVVITNKAMHFHRWLACVAGVKRGRERGNLGAIAGGACEGEKLPSSLLPPPSRAVSRTNSLPFPFRTPATQEFGRDSGWGVRGRKVTLLPRAQSRALIPYPFPFERLPRRLTADKRSFSKYEPLQHSNRKIRDQKIIDSSLALPLDSVLDNSGVYWSERVWCGRFEVL